MHAKSLQLFSTFCDPMGRPLGSSVHRILQARILEWVAISTPGYLPDAEIKHASLVSPALGGRFFTIRATWESPISHYRDKLIIFDEHVHSVGCSVPPVHLASLPWWPVVDSTCQCRRRGFHAWVRRIPWRRKWQPAPVFLPGKSHG